MKGFQVGIAPKSVSDCHSRRRCVDINGCLDLLGHELSPSARHGIVDAESRRLPSRPTESTRHRAPFAAE
jgi:hypothetical protein